MPRPGSWKEFEQFGRFEVSGTLDEALELPEGEVLISVVGLSAPETVDLSAPETVEVELVGPDGPVALRRESSTPSPDFEGLMRIASGTVAVAGPHRLRVSGLPRRELQRAGRRDAIPWLVLVGRAVTAADMVKRSIPGLGLFRRRQHRN